jgi:transposase-like protein/IS1 family transposase
MEGCPICNNEARRFGRNPNGSQRWHCITCNRTFTVNDGERDHRRLATDKMIFCLRLLLEGNSIRSTERLTGVHRDTIIAAMIAAGAKCERWMRRVLQGVPCEDVQADEIWSFVSCKDRTRERQGLPETVHRGDAYTFTALERHSKLIITWHLGKRTPEDTNIFAEKLYDATSGRFQLTTDGFTPYRVHIPLHFGQDVDFAILVKTYGTPPTDDMSAARRYSPGEVLDSEATPISGNPDMARVCTSHVELSNLTIRMQVRRFMRLTNGFSKKWENHEAALGLFFAYYNFCRVHSTIKTTR